jgi:hypothetical protein
VSTIATCDCQGSEFVQIEVVYSQEAEGNVCIHCEHYPVYKINNQKPRPTDEILAGEVSDFIEYFKSPFQDDLTDKKWGFVDARKKERA